MNVSEVAERAGLSPSGVRWYEREGILPPAHRRENGYRDYSQRDLSLLQLITTLRRLGLPAAEAGRVARLCLSSDPGDADVAALLQEQREVIASRRAELAALESEVLDLQATIESTAPHARDSRAGPVSVLFLCNSNSGRSQIGEALLKRLGGGEFSVFSAGAHPKPVSPFALKALAEVEIDWHSARSRPVDQLPVHSYDYVISLSDSMRETCASLPGEHSTLHWNLADPGEVTGPDELRLAAYRRVRDELSLRLRPFIELALLTARNQQNQTREKAHG